LRRSLHYGNMRMDCLTIQLSELVCGYFDRKSHNNFLDLDFAVRVSYDSCLDPCTLVAAMIYIERLRRKNPQAFNRESPNDLYLSSLILATKFLNDCGLDEFIWNDEWAEIAKTNQKNLNKIELRLLDNLDWDIMITPEQFDDAIETIERGVALDSAKIGILSYADVNVLASDLKPYLAHIKRFLIMSLTVASAYVVVCTLSWGLLMGVQKTVETVKEEITQMVIGTEPQTQILENDVILSENQTECSWKTNETKFFELEELEQLLSFNKKDGKLKIEHNLNDPIELLDEKLQNCNSIPPRIFQNLPKIIV